jgi:hypothetical protein
MPLENRREVIAELATAADRAGFDGFYLPETWAYDTTVLLAEAAVKTSRIRLGTGIIGVWNRSAATIAMAAATLASLSSGASSSGWAPARRSWPRACTTCRSARRSGGCAARSARCGRCCAVIAFRWPSPPPPAR